MKEILLLTFFCLCMWISQAQIPIGLQIDSPQVVLFGADTMCCGSRMIWFPAKKALFAGELLWPPDSIGQFSFSAGRSIAPGMLSGSFGQSLVTGDYAFATGGSGAVGNYSFAAGSSSAFGFQSAALGLSGAGGNNSFAAGVSSATGLAASALCNAVADGEVSAAFNKAKAGSYMCTAVGRFNLGNGSPTEYISTDPIFEVGIGSDENNRKNALTIRKDGFVSLGNHLGYTKLALYEFNGATYGMGVLAGQFRFNLGNPQARYAFFNQPGASGIEIFTIQGDGTVKVNGTTVHSSDINKKEKIMSISYSDILKGLENIPITEWQYKGHNERHIGPMAQDFYQAFGLGTDEKYIASIDADGIALAAIKALQEEVQMLKAELQKVKEELKNK
ncbi:MAG: tail fiber domain-containing protein [Saprospiraceae bacterium]|nr:tail fiber domain-containing protein [Saprospiraceae bacterium]